jgi:ABC-type dipeptide/oligopeptide/nickel transport system permease component
MTADQVAAIRHQLGLDLSLWQQYLHWLGQILTGHLGTSLSGAPVISTLRWALLWSLTEFVLAIGVAFVVGSWVGRVAGWLPRLRRSRGLSFMAVGAESVFPPWFTFALAFAVYLVLGRAGIVSMTQFNMSVWAAPAGWPAWAPPPGVQGVELWMVGTVAVFFVGSMLLSRANRVRRRRWSRRMASLLLVAGPVAVWMLVGVWAEAVDLSARLAVPTVTMAVLFYGEITLIVESVVADVRSEPFVDTARAKGLSEPQVRDRHAGRIALLPAVSRLAISLPVFMTALVIVEYSAAYQTANNLMVPSVGIGLILFTSLQNQDMPTVMAMLLAIGVLTLAMRLILDVLVVTLDPRIRTGESRSEERI